jgi:hypothetical protein
MNRVVDLHEAQGGLNLVKYLWGRVSDVQNYLRSVLLG